MPFRVVVSEIKSLEEPEASNPITRYEQVVDDLDLLALMAAVNRKKRAPRTPKAKAGA